VRQHFCLEHWLLYFPFVRKLDGSFARNRNAYGEHCRFERNKSNTNNTLVTISGVYLLPITNNSFNANNQANTCGGNILPTSTCSIFVTFGPEVAGTYTAPLSFSDNAPNSPQTVSLTGTGVLPPTTPGTYTVQVQAVNGADTHYPNVAVNVQ
jgi:hypothetical protein